MQIDIATAPVSWGVLMKDTPNVPPYTQVLDGIKAAGYNGTELWDRQIVNSLRIAIPYDTSYMAADKNRLYVAVEERCLIISAQTGQNHAAFSIPELIGKPNRHWGYVAVTNNMLFGSVQRTTASRTEQSYKAIVDHYKDDQPLVVSEGVSHAYHLYVVRINFSKLALPSR